MVKFSNSAWQKVAMLPIHSNRRGKARLWKAQNEKLQEVLKKMMLGREKGVEGSHVFLEPMVNE